MDEQDERLLDLLRRTLDLIAANAPKSVEAVFETRDGACQRMKVPFPPMPEIRLALPCDLSALWREEAIPEELSIQARTYRYLGCDSEPIGPSGRLGERIVAHYRECA